MIHALIEAILAEQSEGHPAPVVQAHLRSTITFAEVRADIACRRYLAGAVAAHLGLTFEDLEVWIAQSPDVDGRLLSSPDGWSALADYAAVSLCGTVSLSPFFPTVH